MKSFDRITAVFIVLMAAFFLTVNAVLLKQNRSVVSLYKVEANRIEQELLNGRQINADDYANITGIFEYDGSDDFYSSEKEYLIREINGKLYRIEYTDKPRKSSGILIAVDIVLGVFTLIIAAAFIYIRQRILKPFNELSSLPEQLSKKNLVLPLKEHKSRFFGRFICGLDMLRQELEYAKNEKTFLLSLSHDIKAPLSAIKLYSKALSKGIYSSPEKQLAAAESINEKSDEIERIVIELSGKLSTDVMDFEVKDSEFYLSDVIGNIEKYYSDKLSVTGTAFSTGSQQGSGLGLYICRRLMELMNGSIYADTNSGCMNITVVCPKQN